MKILVLGTGYIGLPICLALVEAGFEVAGQDTDSQRIANLQMGIVDFDEEQVDQLLNKNLNLGKLRFIQTVEEADAFIICVPTPIMDNYSPDLSHVKDAFYAVLAKAKQDNLIIVESTCPIGTTDYLIELAKKARLDLFDRNSNSTENFLLDFAYCPERILPGSIMAELSTLDRIIGGSSPKAAERAADIYRKITRGQLVFTSTKVAEMVKLSENAFRDVNIAFANNLESIANTEGLDVREVIRLSNLHPRVQILRPGPGVGGHCIAVDPYFLLNGKFNNVEVIRAARVTNSNRPKEMIARIKSRLDKKNSSDSLIVFLGLSYKANSSDIRESPSLQVVRFFIKSTGTHVHCFDPHLGDHHNKDIKFLRPMHELSDSLKRANLIVLLTDHDEFQGLIDRFKDDSRFLNLRW